jgi:hypothetical protein
VLILLEHFFETSNQGQGFAVKIGFKWFFHQQSETPVKGNHLYSAKLRKNRMTWEWQYLKPLHLRKKTNGAN